ncbi:MAG TPA: glycosyltransferase family 2 protein [Thermodesulfobacteriota bacterium]|nr:glycosyltransferase family 2 protein [Thermodesulfobacteriota bacterium]
MTDKKELVSLVVPVCNEQEVVPETYRRVTAVMEAEKVPYEIVFVDDFSTDSTFEILSGLAEKDPRVKVLSFSRNFGKSAALVAGLDHASGEAVITMDGDLEHPPELIPELLRQWRGGYEVVNTIREYDRTVSLFKRTSSAFFYKLMSKLARVKLPTGSTDFKLYDRKVVDTLTSLEEKNRFLRGLSIWVGFRQTSLNFKSPKRAAGMSKYTPRALFRLALDGITAFSIFPLKVAIYLGFLVSFLSFVYLSYVIFVRLFTERAVPGWASTTASLLLLGGVQLIAIGILGEYIGRIYEEIKRRPNYIISRKVGIEGKARKEERGKQ